MKPYINKLVLLLLLTSYNCKEQPRHSEIITKAKPNLKPVEKNFSGSWSYELESNQNELLNKTFNLTLTNNGTEYYGEYCSIFRNGNKIDCKKNNVKGTLHNDTLYLTLQSEYQGVVNGKLVYLTDKSAQWNKTEHKGEAYVPLKCILEKTKGKKSSNTNFQNLIESLPLVTLPIKLNTLKSKKTKSTFFYFKKNDTYFQLENLESLGYFKTNNTTHILYKFSLLGQGEGFANNMMIISSFTPKGEHLEDIILNGKIGNEGVSNSYTTNNIEKNGFNVEKIEEHNEIDTGLQENIKVYITQKFIVNNGKYKLSSESYNCQKNLSLNSLFNKIQQLYNSNNKDDIYGYSYYVKSVINCFPLQSNNLTTYNDLAYYLQESGNNEEAIYLLEKIITQFPNRVVAYLNLADAYWNTNQKEKAKAHYKKYYNVMHQQNKNLSKIPNRVIERM